MSVISRVLPGEVDQMELDSANEVRAGFPGRDVDGEDTV